MDTRDILILFFSKDRPMQLDAALKSFLRHHKVHNDDGTKKVVLYTCSNERYEKAYENLMKNYSFVKFIKEGVFYQDVKNILANKRFVLFVVDDTIFVKDFNLYNMCEMLLLSNDTIGFSLRLGRNINYCYPTNQMQRLPDFRMFIHDDSYLRFDWTRSEGDFGYPIDLSSSLYKLDIIKPIIDDIYFSNPNALEWELYMNILYTRHLPYLLSFQKSVAFSIPANKVQDVNNNRHGEKTEYDVLELLTRFENGDRIDISKFDNFIPNACHQEVEFDFIHYSSI